MGRARAGAGRAVLRGAVGFAVAAALAACASASHDTAGTAHPPRLEGDYQLTLTVRGGTVQEDVHGILEFREGGWVAWRSLQGGGRRVGPCRYRERGRAVLVECGVDARIEETERGLLATVDSRLREPYIVSECTGWANQNGQRVCVQTRNVERSRIVNAKGEGILMPLGGGGL